MLCIRKFEVLCARKAIRESDPKMSGNGGDFPGKGKGRWVAVDAAAKKKRVRTRNKAPAPSPSRDSPEALVGFDFDCTLTVRHFYKVFAWGYGQGNHTVHPHCKDFVEWCKDHDVAPEMRSGQFKNAGGNDTMGDALEHFIKQSDEPQFHRLFREVFLGGSERILLIAAWLSRMQADGCEFAIITAGVSSSVLRALAAVPEWRPFFKSSRVWDVSQGRHNIQSVTGMKALMLRDICPEAKKILLVDDALGRDPPPAWALSAADVELVELPYEGPGISSELLTSIEESLALTA